MVKAFRAHLVKNQMSTKVTGKNCAPRGDSSPPPQHAPARPVRRQRRSGPRLPLLASRSREMQREGRMKTEIFLQMLQKYHDGDNNHQERSQQRPFLLLAKAGPWKSSARATGALPTAPERAAAMRCASCRMLQSVTSKIQFTNRMFSPLWMHKVIPVPAASSEV